MTNKLFTSFLLSPDDATGLSQYLVENNRLLGKEDIVGVEIAGQGNMNVVLRVSTSDRTFVLKQSRPYVQKYPEVAAPINRTNLEAEFYQLVNGNALWQNATPEIFWFDENNRILCMQDLGESSDFSSIYKKNVNLSKSEIADLASLLSQLHIAPKGPDIINNSAMRELNHAHIFELPLAENNGFDLNSALPGLHQKTEKFRSDEKLRKTAKLLGNIYLEKGGESLLHGDFYPGSWLRTENGIKVIDPEFCFHGKPEFELGVAIAHLKLAQQSNSIMKDLFVYYHFDKRFDGSLFTKFAGMEMIRRLLGLAQLPLDLTLEERLEMLDEAYDLVIHG